MRIRLFQQRVLPEDIEANATAIVEAVGKASADGTGLLIAPEMALCAFDWKGIPQLQGRIERSTQWIRSVVFESPLSLAFSTLAFERDGSARNRLWLFSGKHATCGHYDKIHLFRPLGEMENLVAGESPKVIPIGDTASMQRAGLSVCYDVRFPELYRFEKRSGASLFIVVAGWPVERIETWRLLLRARAAENQIPLVAVNRCGPEPFLDSSVSFGGHSAAIDADGSIITEAGSDACSLDCVLDIGKTTPFDAGIDRRDDLYRHWYGGSMPSESP